MKKLVLGCALALISVGVNAEIVKNSKGKEIQLNSDKTWEYVSSSKNQKKSGRILTKNEDFTSIIPDGNKKPVEIDVWIRIDDISTRTLTEEEVMKLIKTAMSVSTFSLKNEYSFVPKLAIVQLKNNKIEIITEYTSKNSYNADVVGRKGVNFVLNDENEYKLQY